MNLQPDPCPFCGSVNVACRNRYDGWMVQCQNCPETMVHLVSYPVAIETWNNRPAIITAAWLNHSIPVKGNHK